MMRNYRMPIIGKTLSSAALMLAFLVAPSLIANSNSSSSRIESTVAATTAVDNRAADEAAAVIAEAGAMYEAMDLESHGLAKQAFEYAFRGYKTLLEQGRVAKADVLTVADFTKSSREKRLYILDVDDQKVIMQTYVAHGKNSGGEYATSFSNRLESHQSSLGFYVTKNTYHGGHGLSLVLDGMEKGINDNAEARKIVVHGANYIGSSSLKGRSFGCPAVANNLSKKVIQTIKDGSVLFIYHPATSYLNKSRILNG
jgi:hypothetical protein